VPKGFLGIDDLRNYPRGNALESFNVSLHRVSDLVAAHEDLTQFDTESLPGFALSIDAAPSPPTSPPDFTTYMLSVSGPIIPTPSRLFIAEGLNDYSISTYYHAQPMVSAQIAENECFLTHTLVHVKSNRTFLDTLSTFLSPHSTPSTGADSDAHMFKYKPVIKKVKSVPTTLPEEFRMTRKIVGDPLADMPSLSPYPPDFTPTGRYDEAVRDIIDVNHPGSFLLPEGRKLLHHFMMVFERGFAWDESQKGSFHEDFFPPIKIVFPTYHECCTIFLFCQESTTMLSKLFVIRSLPVPMNTAQCSHYP